MGEYSKDWNYMKKGHYDNEAVCNNVFSIGYGGRSNITSHH